MIARTEHARAVNTGTLQAYVNYGVTEVEAINILQEAVKNGHPFQEKRINWGMDLQSEHERYICEKIIDGPVFLTDYPKDIKS